MFGYRINDNEFEVSELKDGERGYRELLTRRAPNDMMFLVRVVGQTGDSFGHHDTSWDAEIFHTREEAEACADLIDENYDRNQVFEDATRRVYNDKYEEALKEIDFYLRNNGVPEDRYAMIRDYIAAWVVNKKNPDKKKGMVAEKERTETHQRVQVKQDGEEITVFTSPWQGYFERLSQVEVITVFRKGSTGTGRRRRRFG